MDRRQFVGQSLGAAIALHLVRGRTRADEFEFPASADPLLRPETRLEDAENAYHLILKASRDLTEMPDFDDDLADCFWGEETSQEHDKHYGKWLDANKSIITSLETAVRIGNLQYPQEPWSDDRFETISGFSRLADLLQLQSQRQASNGDIAGAVSTARLMSVTFRLLKNGGGMYVEYLTAITREADSWRHIRLLAEIPRVDAAQLHELISVAPDRGRSNEAATSAIQSEFCFYLLPELKKLARSDRKKLFEVILGWHENLQPLVSRGEYERRCRLLNDILEGHPCPFDADGTARLASERYSQWIRDLELPWSKHRSLPGQEPSPELAAWPVQLGLSLLDGENSSQVDEKQVALARKELAGVKNPVGRRLIETVALEPKAMHRAALLNQSQLEMTRAVLALWIYKRRKGDFPPSLTRLVEAKILERVPVDPFADGDLCYSQGDRVVWSTGPDDDVTPETKHSDDDYAGLCLWRCGKQ